MVDSQFPLGNSHNFPMNIGVITRTLILGGFKIIDVQRQPIHVEYYCVRTDLFGVSNHYLFVFCSTDIPVEADILHARRIATERRLALVLVAMTPGDDWIGWNEFLQTLGGAVPSWRALGPNYAQSAIDSSQNRVPSGMDGQAWEIFETIVADGLEFIFGHRVRRLGGRKRGLRVSDMITLTPDNRILVVDTKASENPFYMGGPELRPLNEYVRNQTIRQHGNLPVSGALLIAYDFQQDAARLQELSRDFLAETRVPLTLIKTELLIQMILRLKKNPNLRNRLRWAHILCGGGLVTKKDFEREIKSATSETYPRE